MKRRFQTVVLCLLLGIAPAWAQSSFGEAAQRMSNVQALVEFFFMEAGVYPTQLADIEKAFNFKLPKNFQPVPIPTDPATGRPFVYTVGPKHKSYSLKLPDPQAYGGQTLELTQVPWGWMAWRAEQRRFEELAKLSKYHMEQLATQVEMFAKDNAGKYPVTIDKLFPKYIRRHPQDPLSGQNYQYKPFGDGYIIANPNPERYGLKMFQYSSSQGMQVEPLPSKPQMPKTNVQPSAAPTP